MNIYKAKATTLSGTNLAEVTKQARRLFHTIEKRTRRQPYVRSAYFKKQKVFLNYFWPHLHQKVAPERLRRLKYLAAALEVIRSSRQTLEVRQSTTKPDEQFYRFAGRTKEGELFYVHIKENKRTHQLYFMSCFRPRKHKG